jgi:hypothetical protein
MDAAMPKDPNAPKGRIQTYQPADMPTFKSIWDVQKYLHQTKGFGKVLSRG